MTKAEFNTLVKYEGFNEAMDALHSENDKVCDWDYILEFALDQIHDGRYGWAAQALTSMAEIQDKTTESDWYYCNFCFGERIEIIRTVEDAYKYLED